ncbi:MASE1 domain-containing protein [Ralstonia pseudosolanacearum]|uniref:MASE1 domain-containing protein n=1 Tax=Ralstonia pseudosolanacearum TaxID=1310165 RepID=UPI0040540668
MLVSTMGEGWRRRVAIAVMYGLCIYLARQIDNVHWMIVTGVHLCALLLTRPRDWLTLVVVDCVLQVPLSIECASDLGWPWAAFNLVPTVLVMGPIVYWARRHWDVLPSRAVLNMWQILALSLFIAVPVTAFFFITVLVMRLPATYVLDPPKLISQWILGNYMGALTLTPTMLALQQWGRGRSLRSAVDALTDNRRVIESIFMSVPVVSVMVWMGIASPASRPFAQVALFLPVVWLAMRHGWQGAALGGTIASFAVILLMPEAYDRQTIQAEVVIALATSTMLLLGAHVTLLNERAERERMGLDQAIALAQRNVIVSEGRLRTASLAVDQLHETLQVFHDALLHRLRSLAPAEQGRPHQTRAALVQEQIFRVANVLYPIAWRERGLPAALRESAVARSIMESGVYFTADFRGPFSRLSTPLHLAVYRAITDIIVQACTGQPFTDVDVRIRCGERPRRAWVVVSVIFRSDEGGVSNIRWSDLRNRVTRDFGLCTWQVIEDHAATFEGRAGQRTSAGKRRVNMLMFEPQNLAAQIGPPGS